MKETIPICPCPCLPLEGYVLDFDEIAEKGIPYSNQSYDDPSFRKTEEDE